MSMSLHVGVQVVKELACPTCFPVQVFSCQVSRTEQRRALFHTSLYKILHELASDFVASNLCKFLVQLFLL